MFPVKLFLGRSHYENERKRENKNKFSTIEVAACGWPIIYIKTFFVVGKFYFYIITSGVKVSARLKIRDIKIVDL